MTRRRRAIVAFALVASVLVATAPPVASADAEEVTELAAGLVVGSQHDSESEFRGETVKRMTVTDGGSVVLNDPFQYTFEDEPADSGAPEGFAAPNDADASVVSSPGTRGGQSLRLSYAGSNGGKMQARTITSPTPTTSNASAYLYSDNFMTRFQLAIPGEDTAADIAIRGGDLQIFNESGPTTVATAPDNNEWVYIKIFDIDPAADTFSLYYETAAGESDTLELSDGSIPAGGWTTVITRTWNGDAYFDDITAHNVEETRYEGSHSVSNAETAAINLAQASDVSVQATVRTDGGTVLNQTTLSTPGNHSLQLASTSSSNLNTELNVSVTGPNPAFELADESILFTNHAPEASNFQLPDGTDLTSPNTNFEVDVTDDEFGTAQGETVTAELFINGQSVGTDTLQSNGTASVTHTITDGGDHTYHWKISDSYGATTTTATKSVSVPGTLSIRNVSAPSELVDNAAVTLTFFGGDNDEQIVRRETENGKVDLSGLPINTEFTVSVSADGYHTREVILKSLYQQSNIWLLPTSNDDAVEVTFQLQDRTGVFATSDETQLRVQRAINYSGNTAWRDVTGDDISATSDLATVLVNGQRYRLIISNGQQSRILGSYTPNGPADPELITIGKIAFQGDVDVPVSFDAQLNRDAKTVQVMVRDRENNVDQFVYQITNATDGNTTTIVSNTTAPMSGSFTSVTEPLDGETLNGSQYEVSVWAYNTSEQVASRSFTVGALDEPGDGWSEGASKHLLTLAGYVFLVAASYGVANYNPRLGGVTAIVTAAGMTTVGILSIPHVLLGFTGTIVLIQNAAARGGGGT